MTLPADYVNHSTKIRRQTVRSCVDYVVKELVSRLAHSNIGLYATGVVVVGISYDFQCVNFQLTKHQISSEKSTSVNQSQ